MSIYCRGRVYPNAPFTHFTGVIGRSPPHWFQVDIRGLTAEAAVLNGISLAEAWWPADAYVHNPTITWKHGNPAFFPDFWYGVHIDRENGPWEMRLVISSVISVSPFREAWKSWIRQQAGGFDFTSIDTYRVNAFNQSEWWTFGGDSPLFIARGTYDRLPANSCTGV